MSAERLNPEQAAQLSSRISSRLARQGWVAGVLGAVVVFFSIGFLIELFFDADERDALGIANIPIVTSLVVGFGIVITWTVKRRVRRVLAWLLEGRDPDEWEYRQTLRLPAFTSILTAADGRSAASSVACSTSITRSPRRS